MLKPGGLFYLHDVVYSFDPDSYDRFFDSWIDDMMAVAGEEAAEDVETAIREEYATLDWIMEGLLKKSGFAIQKAEYRDGFLADYLCSIASS